MHGPVAQAWLAAIEQLGGVPTTAAAELEQRYQEPHRRYHTLTHVEAVLEHCAWLATQVGLNTRGRALVMLAACAHDVVYDGRPGVDEESSANWARDRLAVAGVAEEDGERVSQLVLATATHETDSTDVECCVLLDSDLSILGADEQTYARYVDAVRAEYGALADDVWRAGRAAVLRSLLAHPALYATEPARLKWDARARHNLSAELAGLVD